MLRRLLKEPLIHFTALALVIFGSYAVFNPSESEQSNRIVITAPKIEQLAGLFVRTWQRPPTIAELKGLIDDYAKEEIYYREALKLGLDKDDTLIRRRLRLKMEFLSNAEAEGLAPTDAELEAYLRANPDKFEIDPLMAFEQVYLNPERRGSQIDQDAVSILETLRRGGVANATTLGDATLLPAELSTTSKRSIGDIFGREFADAIDKVPAGQWRGPIKSAFGLHLIRVTEHQTGRIPALEEIRDVVKREWSNEKRKALEEAYFNRLLQRYQVSIESPPPDGASR